MNFEFFTARRIIASKDYKSSVSAPIIKIAIAAITLGMVIMLVTIATSVGLQKKIREKVSAFNGDIIISNFDTNTSDESQVAISKNQNFYPKFTSVEGIRHIQVTASKGGIIRTETDFEGVVAKGVGADYDW
ncbi:MAG TPA: transmembrane permease, partial [Flavobacteriaceae bacterium]|nr:transmembrane permease [Flavobacteriaceae bacterium]